MGVDWRFCGAAITNWTDPKPDQPTLAKSAMIAISSMLQRRSFLGIEVSLQPRAKWNSFIQGLRDRVDRLPLEKQEAVFRRAAARSAERVAMARINFTELRADLGIPE
jgi:hypothetical protein